MIQNFKFKLCYGIIKIISLYKILYMCSENAFFMSERDWETFSSKGRELRNNNNNKIYNNLKK